MADVERIGVVGAGFMGSGIAESAARAGVAVKVYEPDAAPLEHSHLQSRGGQIAGANQTVVAGTYDQGVVGGWIIHST